MRHSYLKPALVLCTALIISACNDNDGNGNNVGALQQLTDSAPNGESQEILDPVGLENNITRLFGAADGEPIDINGNDTVSTVVQRLN